MKKYVVLQDGNKECGAACLLSIIKYYGGNIGEQEQFRNFSIKMLTGYEHRLKQMIEESTKKYDQEVK